MGWYNCFSVHSFKSVASSYAQHCLDPYSTQEDRRSENVSWIHLLQIADPPTNFNNHESINHRELFKFLKKIASWNQFSHVSALHACNLL